MKRINRVQIFSFAIGVFLTLALYGETRARQPVPDALHGIWENENRFVEFTDQTLRIVLKPYYQFVYESFPPLSCVGLPVPAPFSVDGVYALSLRYPREKNAYPITLARAGDALFMHFWVRLTDRLENVSDLSASLDGVWFPGSSGSSLRLYPNAPTEDFFVLIFDGTRYFRVRYWKTDAREREVNGRFTGKNGKDYSLPKFFRVDGTLYTCISATGTLIRNFEEGQVQREEGALTFKPDRVAFTGTAATYRKPIPYTLDGDVLALGEPYLVRSAYTDLDTTIAEHNAKRRPPRRPLFDFLELDFHWDEVARLRGNSLDR